MTDILVCQHNILSSLWLVEEYKLLPCYESYFDENRIRTTMKYLEKFRADVYCLSEVEKDQLPLVSEGFAGYHGVFASNKPGYWGEWLGNREWKPNGTCILVNAERFELIDNGYIDLEDGCICCFVLAKSDGELFLIVSVHFDTSDKKYAEASALLEKLDELARIMCPDVVIVAGDYNFTDISMFSVRGYVENLHHPLNTTPLPQGVIDHTLLMSCSRRFELKSKVAQIRGKNNNFVEDMCSTVMQNGSDHYATLTLIQ